MLTLRQLRYLDALARHGHFGHAAKECSVSQPALSMQISELEKELGAKLVEHRQGATALTEIGREAARRAVLAGSGYLLRPMRSWPVRRPLSHRINKGRPITGDAQKENPVLSKSRPRLARCQCRKQLRFLTTCERYMFNKVTTCISAGRFSGNAAWPRRFESVPCC